MIKLVLNNSPIFEQTGYPFQVVLKADAPVGIVFVSCFALHTYESKHARDYLILWFLISRNNTTCFTWSRNALANKCMRCQTASRCSLYFWQLSYYCMTRRTRYVGCQNRAARACRVSRSLYGSARKLSHTYLVIRLRGKYLWPYRKANPQDKKSRYPRASECRSPLPPHHGGRKQRQNYRNLPPWQSN